MRKRERIRKRRREKGKSIERRGKMTQRREGTKGGNKEKEEREKKGGGGAGAKRRPKHGFTLSLSLLKPERRGKGSEGVVSCLNKLPGRASSAAGEMRCEL